MIYFSLDEDDFFYQIFSRKNAISLKMLRN